MIVIGEAPDASGFGEDCRRDDRTDTAEIEELQADLDAWLQQYNDVRTHQGRWCYGKTPMQTFLDTIPIAKEKMLAA